MKTKTCNKCKKEKDLNDFFSRGGQPHLKRSECKSCYTKKTTARTLSWQKNKPELKRQADLKHKLKNVYKISEEDYNDLIERQNNLCAICCKPEERKYKGQPCRLSIDHCHSSGKVRALLCSKCNTALGLLDDDVEKFMDCIRYLQLHKIEIESIQTREL